MFLPASKNRHHEPSMLASTGHSGSPRREAGFSPGKGIRFVRRIHRLRTLGLGVGFLCVATAMAGLDASPALWVLLLLNGYAWPHLACQWALRSRSPFAAEYRNLLIDIGLAGFWVVAMRGNIMPSTVIIAMMCMNNIASGGVRLFLFGLVSALAGMLAGAALLGVRLAPQTSVAEALSCLPLLFLYTLVLGKSTYDIAKKLARQSREFEAISQRDGLTGLYNRRHFESLLKQVLDDCRRGGHGASLLLLDLDFFKHINDTHGHQVGDTVLRNFSRLLENHLRQEDIIARYGGEEFVIIINRVDEAGALALTRRIVERVRALQTVDNTLWGCTVSAGLVPYAAHLDDDYDWVRRADHAMYQSKNAGRNRLTLGR